jgi:hypothetical protein
MEFITAEEVWMFWISYGGKKDFEVRKRYTNKRKSDGKVRSRRFVCANEGYRVEDKRDHLLVAEFSLSLRVRMTLRGWEFSGFFLKHTTMPCPPKGVGDTYL